MPPPSPAAARSGYQLRSRTVEPATAACALRPCAARLYVHAEGGITYTGLRVEALFRNLLTRLRCSSMDGTSHSLRLQIQDLRKQCVRVVDDAEKTTDLALPPGTYHITATLGQWKRRYTMTLEPGTTFHLYLRLFATRR